MDLPQYDPRKIKVQQGEHPEDLKRFRDDPSLRGLWEILQGAIQGTVPTDIRSIDQEQAINDRIRRAEIRRMREMDARGERLPRLSPEGHRTAWAHYNPPR